MQAEFPTYQGQFGEYTITADDRQGVLIYRASLFTAALAFAIGTGLALWQGNSPTVMHWVTVCYGLFSLGLGVALWTIHIYMVALHRVLQGFWLIGTTAAIGIALTHAAPLPLVVYQAPLTILGIGFTFAALTGLFFKEAFCFNRLETKFLTPLVPGLLLGHLLRWLSPSVEAGLLVAWAVLFLVFALRKMVQAIPDDIGDKSVFAYLKQKASQKADLVDPRAVGVADE